MNVIRHPSDTAPADGDLVFTSQKHYDLEYRKFWNIVRALRANVNQFPPINFNPEVFSKSTSKMVLHYSDELVEVIGLWPK